MSGLPLLRAGKSGRGENPANGGVREHGYRSVLFMERRRCVSCWSKTTR
jgi:hypothetical protein